MTFTSSTIKSLAPNQAPFFLQKEVLLPLKQDDCLGITLNGKLAMGSRKISVSTSLLYSTTISLIAGATGLSIDNGWIGVSSLVAMANEAYNVIKMHSPTRYTLDGAAFTLPCKEADQASFATVNNMKYPPDGILRVPASKVAKGAIRADVFYMEQYLQYTETRGCVRVVKAISAVDSYGISQDSISHTEMRSQLFSSGYKGIRIWENSGTAITSSTAPHEVTFSPVVRIGDTVNDVLFARFSSSSIVLEGGSD